MNFHLASVGVLSARRDNILAGQAGCVLGEHISGLSSSRVSDVSSIGACRPRIFFIKGLLCFLEDEWQRNGEGRERGNATSRRR